VAWIDTLDSTPQKVAATDANRMQTRGRDAEEEFSQVAQDAEAEEVSWLPPGIRTLQSRFRRRHASRLYLSFIRPAPGLTFAGRDPGILRI